MFFIVNHENSIIAADADFLEGIGADNIYEAALLIQKGEVVLDELRQSVSYLQKSNTFSKTKLSTFLGDAYLYEINEKEEQAAEEPQEAFQEEALFNLAIPQVDLHDNTAETTEAENPTEHLELETREEEVFSLIDTGIASDASQEDGIEDLLDMDTPSSELFKNEEIEISEDSILSSKDTLGFVDTEAETDTSAEGEEEEQKIDLEISHEPYSSLIKSEEEKGTKEESSFIPSDNLSILSAETASTEAEVYNTEHRENDENTVVSEVEEPPQKNTINTQEIAELIGISEEEYLHFLDDFKKESTLLEPVLRSTDLKESREALSNLKEASLLLHLPQITEKLNAFSDATSDEKSSMIDDYLVMVAQINSMANKNEKSMIDLTDSKVDEVEEAPVLDNKYLAEEIEHPITLEEPVAPSTEKVLISLDQVQPIPFDFIISEAADELTLPASLVSEFIIDFINQAKENLPVLQKAYEEKDLETLHTTAHMLKGASSNLRITPMADTLYKLQFNEDMAQVPELIALFTGQLKALSIQMDQV